MEFLNMIRNGLSVIKKAKIWLACIVGTAVLTACDNGHRAKVVICVPVYGQSLAMGEEAELVTDIDGLTDKWQGRLVGEGLGDAFGYYEDHGWKRQVKRLLRYGKRRYENSAYSMGETLAGIFGRDTMVCVFADGRGGTPISELVKGSEPYDALIHDIRTSYNEARKKGMDFVVPALCWMQGESDMYDYTGVDYLALLGQFARDVNRDVKQITGQRRDVKIVTYQSCCMTKCRDFHPDDYDCHEISVAQSQMQLIRDDSLFVAGTPVYFLDFVDERLHIDGKSQTAVGRYNAMAVADIVRHGRCNGGLYPVSVVSIGNIVTVGFNHRDGLTFDTIQVRKAENYGFCVITSDNRDITEDVRLTQDGVVIRCSGNTNGCMVRYGCNGESDKSGRLHGARGNLVRRSDDAGLPQWCYIFSEQTTER